MNTFLTLGGRVSCTQCQARSKRTRLQCRSPAIAGKTKCRIHGGRSTGPRTAEGKARIAAAHTVHGRETAEARANRRARIKELQELEALGPALGMIGGTRTRGPKVKM